MKVMLTIIFQKGKDAGIFERIAGEGNDG